MALATALFALAAILLTFIVARVRPRAAPAPAAPQTPAERQVHTLAAAKLQLEHLYALGLHSLHANLPYQAARTLLLAAERGHARAQLHYGVLCEHGIGVPLDRARAAHWYQRAIDQGDTDAQFRLQVMYAEMQTGNRRKVRAFSATIAADGEVAAGGHLPRNFPDATTNKAAA